MGNTLTKITSFTNTTLRGAFPFGTKIVTNPSSPMTLSHWEGINTPPLPISLSSSFFLLHTTPGPHCTSWFLLSTLQFFELQLRIHVLHMSTVVQ